MTHLSKLHKGHCSDTDENFYVFFDNKIKSKNEIELFIENAKKHGSNGITILLGCDYISDLAPLNEYLKTIDIPISGGVFPEIIHDDEYYNDAVVIISWNSKVKVNTFYDISDPCSELYQQEATTVEDENHSNNSACLVFVDAKTRSSEGALDALYYRSENDYQYAGAGAGYLCDEQLPCIICNEGIVKDALQTIKLSLHQDNNVSYGWTILSGPHLVTSSVKNKVFTLDYLPIGDQYQKFIQNNTKEDISGLSVQDLISKYPFGIYHYGEDMVVRDPYKFSNGAIEFFGDIPEFSNIYILTGEPQQLIQEVKNSLKLFIQREHKAVNTLSLLFSCIGRRNYMGPNSEIELGVISGHLSAKNPVIGTSSFGEIATNEAGLLRFHAMSLVVSSLYQ